MLRQPTPLARTSSNFSANFSTSSRRTENERAVNIRRRVEIEKGPAQCRAFFCVLSQLLSSIDGRRRNHEEQRGCPLMALLRRAWCFRDVAVFRGTPNVAMHRKI